MREPHAREEVLEDMAFANANERCQNAILSLPMEPPPTLEEVLKVCEQKVPMMRLLAGQRTKPSVRAAAADTTNASATKTSTTTKRSTWSSPKERCYHCGKMEHWVNQCPNKKDFHDFRGQGEAEAKGQWGAKCPLQKTKGRPRARPAP